MPKGYKHTEESKRKMRLNHYDCSGKNNSMYGKKPSEESKRKISEANKGQIPWNKGKTGCYSEETIERLRKANIGKKMSEETKRKLSEAKKGSKASEEAKRKMRGRIVSEETRKKIRKINKGRKHTEEAKRKISKAQKGKNNNNWQGGISFEPYGLEFNNKLREQIRKRDNYRCQQCFQHQDALFENYKAGIRRRKLSVHHIDYQKTNNNPENLISLCRSCHQQTNFKREDWEEYFKNRIKN